MLKIECLEDNTLELIEYIDIQQFIRKVLNDKNIKDFDTISGLIGGMTAIKYYIENGWPVK